MEIYVIVLGCIAFDVLTGLIKAGYNHNFDSTKMRQGGYHKVSEIVALIGAGLAEYYDVANKFGVSIPLLGAVSGYIILTEVCSILENLSEVDPNLKKFFGKYLTKLKDTGDDSDV